MSEIDNSRELSISWIENTNTFEYDQIILSCDNFTSLYSKYYVHILSPSLIGKVYVNNNANTNEKNQNFYGSIYLTSDLKTLIITLNEGIFTSVSSVSLSNLSIQKFLNEIIYKSSIKVILSSGTETILKSKGSYINSDLKIINELESSKITYLEIGNIVSNIESKIFNYCSLRNIQVILFYLQINLKDNLRDILSVFKSIIQFSNYISNISINDIDHLVESSIDPSSSLSPTITNWKHLINVSTSSSHLYM